MLGAVTAAFAALGSLGAITACASLAFIVVFGLVAGLGFRSDGAETVALVPAVGAVELLWFERAELATLRPAVEEKAE